MEAHEQNNALWAQTQPPPGVLPAPLSEVAESQGRLVAPACPCGGVPSLVPVVMVQEAAQDDATIAFLLSQTLLAKEMEVLEPDLASKEQRLVEEIERDRSSAERPSRDSRVEVAAAWWVLTKLALRKRKTKKKKEGGGEDG